MVTDAQTQLKVRTDNTVPGIRLTAPAQRDSDAILRWTRREFGAAAERRYATLIGQALRDIAENPERAGSTLRRDIRAGVRTWHLAMSRNRVKGRMVKDPRHVLVYRQRGDIVEVARILHDSRDLARHVAG